MMHFRGGNTPRSPLIIPKNRDNITQKSTVLYIYKCSSLDCNKEYIGESSRNLGGRLKEHLIEPSPIYDYANYSGHNTKLDNFSIVGSKSHTIARTIQEAIFIRVNDPSLNRKLASTSCPTYGMRSC